MSGFLFIFVQESLLLDSNVVSSLSQGPLHGSFQLRNGSNQLNSCWCWRKKLLFIYIGKSCVYNNKVLGSCLFWSEWQGKIPNNKKYSIRSFILFFSFFHPTIFPPLVMYSVWVFSHFSSNRRFPSGSVRIFFLFIHLSSFLFYFFLGEVLWGRLCYCAFILDPRLKTPSCFFVPSYSPLLLLCRFPFLTFLPTDIASSLCFSSWRRLSPRSRCIPPFKTPRPSLLLELSLISKV